MNWEDFIRKCLRTEYSESDEEEQERYLSHPYLARHLAMWWSHLAHVKDKQERDGIDDNNPYPKKKEN